MPFLIFSPSSHCRTKTGLILYSTGGMGHKKAALALKERFDVVTCVTGQHRELLDQVLDIYSISRTFKFNDATSYI